MQVKTQKPYCFTKCRFAVEAIAVTEKIEGNPKIGKCWAPPLGVKATDPLETSPLPKRVATSNLVLLCQRVCA